MLRQYGKGDRIKSFPNSQGTKRNEDMHSMDIPGMNSTRSRDPNVKVQVSLGNSCSKGDILPFSFVPRSVVGDTGR